MTYITKGEQFWNEDHTEGYEALEDIHPLMPLIHSQVQALGASEPVSPYSVVPYWFQAIVFEPGGVEDYRSKAKEHNNIKEG